MKVQKEDGSALLLTMVLILVLVFLGGAFTLQSLTEVKQARREEEQLQAYYLARSGADALAYYLEERPEEIESISTKGESIRIGTGDKDIYGAFVQVFVEDCQCYVQSTGCSGNCSCTVCLCMLRRPAWPPIDQVIFAKGGETDSEEAAISLSGSAKVIGDVATNAARTNAIKMGGKSFIEGDLALGPNLDPGDISMGVQNRVSGEITTLADNLNYPETFWPDFDSWQGEFAEDLTVKNGFQKSIDLEFGHKKIKIRALDVKQNGIIKLTNIGTEGRLELYVTEKFRMAEGASFVYEGYVGDEPDPQVLTIYYGGEAAFVGRFREDFYGNLVVRQSSVDITADSKINGSILSQSPQNVVLHSGTMAAGIVYAPNAKVEIKSGVQAGAIVANQLLAYDDSSIVYDEKFSTDTLPEDVIRAGGNGDGVLIRDRWVSGKMIAERSGL